MILCYKLLKKMMERGEKRENFEFVVFCVLICFFYSFFFPQTKWNMDDWMISKKFQMPTEIC